MKTKIPTMGVMRSHSMTMVKNRDMLPTMKNLLMTPTTMIILTIVMKDELLVTTTIRDFVTTKRTHFLIDYV